MDKLIVKKINSNLIPWLVTDQSNNQIYVDGTVIIMKGIKEKNQNKLGSTGIFEIKDVLTANLLLPGFSAKYFDTIRLNTSCDIIKFSLDHIDNRKITNLYESLYDSIWSKK